MLTLNSLPDAIDETDQLKITGTNRGNNGNRRSNFQSTYRFAQHFVGFGFARLQCGRSFRGLFDDWISNAFDCRYCNRDRSWTKKLTFLAA